MTTKDAAEKAALLKKYVPLILPILPEAKKAFGSRDTISPQHDASREYTRLLCEYYEQGGSLLDMAKALDVAYAGLNRRVSTCDIPASSKRPRKRFPQEVYDAAVAEILAAKAVGTKEYHEALAEHYAAGLSLAKIATGMGLSSANPLYYGVSRVALSKVEDE